MARRIFQFNNLIQYLMPEIIYCKFFGGPPTLDPGPGLIDVCSNEAPMSAYEAPIMRREHILKAERM